jgi:hypothetical protein
LQYLNDSLWGKTSPPYIYESARTIEGYPIIKTQNPLLFLSSNPKLSFPNPNFLSPFIPVALGGGSSWPADARSTQGASSPMGSLPEGSSLVQTAEAVQTGHTDNHGQLDRSELRRQEVLHVVVFMFNDTFRCQHAKIIYNFLW